MDNLLSNKLLALVAIEQTVYHFDKPYSYFIPKTLTEKAKIGARVLVQFGRGNRRRLGVILDIIETDNETQFKEIECVIDETPFLNDESIKIIKWLKSRTFCTYFDAIKTILPAGLAMRTVIKYQLADKNTISQAEHNISFDMRAVIDSLEDGSAQPREKILDNLKIPISSDLLEEMEKLGLLLRIDEHKQRMKDSAIKMVRLSSEFLSGETVKKFTKKQKDVVDLLSDIEIASTKELIYFTGVSMAVINNLANNGFLTLYERPTYKNPYSEIEEPEKLKINLSTAQQTAYESLVKRHTEGGGTTLIYGVTGSGKTQVFLKFVDYILDSGKNAIIMVPEIALTPQTLSIFHGRYGSSVAVFHSAMTLRERMDEWKRVKDGKVSIAVGTRSAVFAPFDNLGLIVIDEEQEHTYKSENSPRYHAREVAEYRMKYHAGSLVLASATPSVETFSKAKNGVYSLCTLPSRYGTATLPDVITIDMKSEIEKGNTSIISGQLLSMLKENVENEMQSILLLNRRGHNTYVSCRACSHVMTCENCSISLTYHLTNGRLMCHYCGHSTPYSNKCPMCGEEHMKYAGIGTQRVEAEIKILLPGARVLRLDADSVMSRTDFESALDSFGNLEYDILLGTQMVAKGLNFPKVTLVGVLAADRAMYSDDFRSFERAFSLITQVVGRSGRGEASGMAVIQTTDPDNKIIEYAASQNYDNFYETEILTRKVMVYPPYCDICMVGFVGTNKEMTLNSSNDFLAQIKKHIAGDFADVKLIILGPTPANVSKVNNKYRFRLLIKCRMNNKTRKLIDLLICEFQSNSKHKNITVFVDINPESML